MRNRKMRTFVRGALACAAPFVFAAAANAATITELTMFGDPPIGSPNVISDDSVELFHDLFMDVLDANGNVIGSAPGADGKLSEGDIVEGIFNVTSYNGVGIGGTSGHSEFTAYFRNVVVSKTATADPEKFRIAFGPDATWAHAIALGVGGKAMVLMYEDTTPDYPDNSPATPANGPFLGYPLDIARATDGTFFWALGFNGTLEADGTTSLDEGWVAPSSLDTIPADGGELIGSADLALNRVFTPLKVGTGESWDLVLRDSKFDADTIRDDAEFTGTTTFKTIEQTSGNWPVANDGTNLTFNAIPTPAAAWGCMVMFGLLGVTRQRRQMA